MSFSFVELSSATRLSLILLIVSDSLVMDCWKRYLYSVLSLWGGKITQDLRPTSNYTCKLFKYL